MKYIKTFESYNQSEKVDENLKSFIAGTLLSLSSLFPGKADAFIGGGVSGGHVVATTNHSINTQEIKDDSQQIKDDITDPVLKDIKKSIDDGIQSKAEIDSIITKLKAYADKNNSHSDVKKVLEDLSKIDFNGDKEVVKGDLLKIIIKLNEMQKSGSFSINDLMVIAILLLFLTLFIKLMNEND
jgi:hypothetical protein